LAYLYHHGALCVRMCWRVLFKETLLVGEHHEFQNCSSLLQECMRGAEYRNGVKVSPAYNKKRESF
jgi:hypothetical protein